MKLNKKQTIQFLIAYFSGTSSPFKKSGRLTLDGGRTYNEIKFWEPSVFLEDLKKIKEDFEKVFISPPLKSETEVLLNPELSPLSPADKIRLIKRRAESGDPQANVALKGFDNFLTEFSNHFKESVFENGHIRPEIIAAIGYDENGVSYYSKAIQTEGFKVFSWMSESSGCSLLIQNSMSGSIFLLDDPPVPIGHFFRKIEPLVVELQKLFTFLRDLSLKHKEVEEFLGKVRTNGINGGTDLSTETLKIIAELETKELQDFFDDELKEKLKLWAQNTKILAEKENEDLKKALCLEVQERIEVLDRLDKQEAIKNCKNFLKIAQEGGDFRTAYQELHTKSPFTKDEPITKEEREINRIKWVVDQYKGLREPWGKDLKVEGNKKILEIEVLIKENPIAWRKVLQAEKELKRIHLYDWLEKTQTLILKSQQELPKENSLPYKDKLRKLFIESNRLKLSINKYYKNIDQKVYELEGEVQTLAVVINNKVHWKLLELQKHVFGLKEKIQNQIKVHRYKGNLEEVEVFSTLLECENKLFLDIEKKVATGDITEKEYLDLEKQGDEFFSAYKQVVPYCRYLKIYNRCEDFLNITAAYDEPEEDEEQEEGWEENKPEKTRLGPIQEIKNVGVLQDINIVRREVKKLKNKVSNGMDKGHVNEQEVEKRSIRIVNALKVLAPKVNDSKQQTFLQTFLDFIWEKVLKKPPRTLASKFQHTAEQFKLFVPEFALKQPTSNQQFVLVK